MSKRLIGSFPVGARSASVVGLLLLVTALLVASPATAATGEEFGFTPDGFTTSITNADGTPDTQAGSHPFAFTTTIAVKSVEEETYLEEIAPRAEGGDVRDIEVNLPPGFVGDPSATPLCSAQKFAEGFSFSIGTVCSEDSQIGTVDLHLNNIHLVGPVYNLVPPKGNPAEFGFSILGVPVVLVPFVRTGSDYGVGVRFTGIPEAFSMVQGTITL